MELNTVGQLITAATQAGLTWHAHAIHAGPRRVFPTSRREVARLAAESVDSAETRRVEDLQENRGAPPFGRISAAVARQRRGERLDEQGERETFVSVVDSARRQQRAGRIGEQRRRVIRGAIAG